MQPPRSEPTGKQQEINQRQMGEKCQVTQRTQGAHKELSGRQVGDKGGTHVESCRPKHPERTGREVRDKCSVMRPRQREEVGDKWGTSMIQTGNKSKIMCARAPKTGDNVATSGKQMGNELETRAYSEIVGDKWTRSPRAIVGGKSERSGKQNVESRGPEHPEHSEHNDERGGRQALKII